MHRACLRLAHSTTPLCHWWMQLSYLLLLLGVVEAVIYIATAYALGIL